MPTPVLINGGTKIEWSAENPILPNGFIGIETDTQYSKTGDGLTSWNALEYDLEPGLPLGALYIRPNKFEWPSYLPDIYAYKNGNNFFCNIGPEDLIDTSLFTRTYFVDARDGVDASSGLTFATRKKTIRNAMIAASASGIPSRILVYTDGGEIQYTRPRSWGANLEPFVSAVPMLIEAMDGRVVVGAFDTYAYTLTAASTYTWQTTRSNIARVFNPSIKDSKGLYLEYTWVASAALVETTPGSWFTNNVTCYIHPHNNVPATDLNTRMIILGEGAGWNCNQNLFVRGFDFEGGIQGAFIVEGGTTNRVVFDDCTFRYSAVENTYISGSTTIDGIKVKGCMIFAAFNCKADKNSKDGFNFHKEFVNGPYVLLVNCSGYKNGLYPSGSNNGFTTHDGIKSIDIGGKWTGSRGGNSAHVNANTQLWAVGCTAGMSAGDVITGGVDTFGGFAAWQGSPEIWLDSCIDLGCETGIYAGDSAIIYLRNHKGTGSKFTDGLGSIVNF